MNILIIGLGSIGLKHVTAILEVLTPPFRLFALRSNAQCNTIEGVQNVFNLDEITESLDFVIISNPTNLHITAIEQCAYLKVPLFIEKPVCRTLSEATNILGLLKEVPTYVACNLRFHPAILFLRANLFGNKRINEVNVYCGSYLPDWRIDKEFRKIYSVDPKLGGGVHLDLIHEIDYCCWLFGFPNSSDMLKRSVSSIGIEAVDYANCRLIYSEFTTNIILNYYRRDAKRSIEIVFDDDTWTIDLIDCTIKNNIGNVVFSEEHAIFQTYTEQMRYFIKSIANKEKLMNGIDEAVETLKIVLS